MSFTSSQSHSSLLFNLFLSLPTSLFFLYSLTLYSFPLYLAILLYTLFILIPHSPSRSLSYYLIPSLAHSVNFPTFCIPMYNNILPFSLSFCLGISLSLSASLTPFLSLPLSQVLKRALRYIPQIYICNMNEESGLFLGGQTKKEMKIKT